MFSPIIEQLDGAGLGARANTAGWSRIIIEKPFGTDLDSARALQAEVEKVFPEKQVYRIDHYLGKEPVQDIMALRFANVIFEPVWNRRYVDSVQITAAETVGVERRGGYYDNAGALRDMIQNHVMNLLALVAMEPPVASDADSIRDEKFKVLRAVRPIEPGRVILDSARGQYDAGSIDGKPVPGYREEPDVRPDSNTETYAAVKLWIDNWRWADVPFYMRSGKRLGHKNSEIAIRFRSLPHRLFGEAGDALDNNVLVMKIQPEEGISLRFNAKVPGPRMHIRSVSMDFNYGTGFGVVSAPAYERLIGDAMRGDATLFTRWDAVETAWQIVMPILENWTQYDRRKLPELQRGKPRPAAVGPADGARRTRVAQDMNAESRVEASLEAIRGELARAPATTSTLNFLVWIDDPERRAWILERAAMLSEKHPSFTLILDNTGDCGRGATITTQARPQSEIAVQGERVEIDVSCFEASSIAAFVEALRGSGVPTLLWWSGMKVGSRPVFDALLPFADTLLVDSAGASPTSAASAASSPSIAIIPDVVLRDLAWLRLRPWLDMIANFFDDPQLTRELFGIRRLTVASGSAAEALYLAGWLASSLGWTAIGQNAFSDLERHAIEFAREQSGADPARAQRPARHRDVALRRRGHRGRRKGRARVGRGSERFRSLGCFRCSAVDNASLLERAVLETGTDELFETALGIVGTLVG